MPAPRASNFAPTLIHGLTAAATECRAFRRLDANESKPSALIGKTQMEGEHTIYKNVALTHCLYKYNLSKSACMRRYLPFALVCCLISACMIPAPGDFGAPASTTPGEVPFELAPPNDAAIIVPVKINGRGPFKFVLDTGATFTCIDQKLVDQLKLPEWKGPLGVGIIQPIAGSVKFVSLDTFEVGSVKATDMKACAIEFSQLQTGGLDARGLVGLNFLKSFQVRIDFKKKVLSLNK